nr:hypothetical protein [Planctomycetota bacterium]
MSQDALWYVHRLRAMSPGEIAWRVSSKVRTPFLRAQARRGAWTASKP